MQQAKQPWSLFAFDAQGCPDRSCREVKRDFTSPVSQHLLGSIRLGLSCQPDQEWLLGNKTAFEPLSQETVHGAIGILAQLPKGQQSCCMAQWAQ